MRRMPYPVQSERESPPPSRLRRSLPSRDRKGAEAQFLRQDLTAPSRSRLGFARQGVRGRRAFTLAELLVALAILVAMMAMIATIFSTASKAAGQAESTTKLQRALQQITEVIRNDLGQMQTGADGGDVLAIAGVSVNAVDRPGEAPSWHRADVLMVMTGGQFDPYVYSPSSTDRFQETRHVVYGHANIGKLAPDGSWLSMLMLEPEDPDDVSPIPASQWHLARRVVGFPVDYTKLSAPKKPDGWLCNTAGWPLSGRAFTGEAIGDDFADVFAGTYGGSPQGYFEYWRDAPDKWFEIGRVGRYYFVDDTTNPQERFRYDSPMYGGPGYFYLHTDGFWYQNDGSIKDKQWKRTDPIGTLTATSTKAPPLANSFNPSLLNLRYWPSWFYTGTVSRVWLDPAPPMGQTPRMAPYFLPACAEFKVEYTYDDASEIMLNAEAEPDLIDWDGDGKVDPEDLAPIGPGYDYWPAPTPIRWESAGQGQLLVWSQLSTNPGDYKADGDKRDLTNPFRWPRALRITIRAYPPGGSAEDGITQTIIHTWQ